MATINGSSGNDTLTGTSGNDTLNGLGGNDLFLAGSTGGADVIDGGAGFDSIEFRERATSAVVVDFAAGTIGGGSSGTISFTNIERVVAGNFNDRLSGNASSQILTGQAGADTLWGAGGNDTLWGGGGADRFMFREIGTANADSINDFASGADKLVLDGSVMSALGAAGNFAAGDARFQANSTGTATDASDRIIYNTTTRQVFYDADGNGSGARVLIGTLQSGATLAATDIVVEGGGGGGGQTIIGTSGNDSLVGGPGNDTIAGFEGEDTLDGGAGNDTLTTFVGLAGNNDVYQFSVAPGSANADFIPFFHPGFDSILLDSSVMTALGASGSFAEGDTRFYAADGASSGHDTDDRVIYDTTTGNLWYDADGSGAGATQLIATVLELNDAPAALAASDIAVDTVTAPRGQIIGGDNRNETLVGGDFNDWIDGDGGNDTLFGMGGNDTLFGRSDDDLLVGGEGADSMFGGSGNDTLDGGDGNDTISAAGDESLLVYSVAPGAANADIIVDFGSDTFQLDGTVHVNSGPSGRFAAGDARFWSSGTGAAHDADDRVIYNTANGQLWYDADGNGAGAAQLIATLQGAPTLAATDIEVINGSGSGGQVINGTSGNDTLTGTSGNDTISGFGGNDLFLAGSTGGADVINGGTGSDSIEFKARRAAASWSISMPPP